MTEPILYVDTFDCALPALSSAITERLLSFLPPPNRFAEGRPDAMHRMLLPYWRAIREREIRFKRLGDERVEAEWGEPPTIRRTRRYLILTPEHFDGGILKVTTLWVGRRIGIMKVEAPAREWR